MLGVPVVGIVMDLNPASRREHLVFYDPSGIPDDTAVDPDLEEQDPKLPPKETIRSLTENGQALVVKIPGDDCEALVRLYVNEPPAETVLHRGKLKLSGARLNLPSGTLRADGLEFTTRPGEERLHSEGDSVEVEPGLYEVELWDLFSWKLRNVDPYVDNRTTALDRVVSRLVTAYTWLGILLLPANILLAPMLIASSNPDGWAGPLTVLGLIIAFDALVLTGFWILDWVGKRIPAISRVSDLRREFELENPDIALVLSRATANELSSSPAMVVLQWG